MLEKKKEKKNCPVLHTDTQTQTLFSVFQFVMGLLYNDRNWNQRIKLLDILPS